MNYRRDITIEIMKKIEPKEFYDHKTAKFDSSLFSAERLS